MEKFLKNKIKKFLVFVNFFMFLIFINKFKNEQKNRKKIF